MTGCRVAEVYFFFRKNSCEINYCVRVEKQIVPGKALFDGPLYHGSIVNGENNVVKLNLVYL